MAPKARVQKRLYYKIGEACKALGIQPYVLRYWETEFPALSPSKSRSGQRVYSEKELEIIRRIKQLLYDEGYTIAGAKKKLEGELAAGTLGEFVPAQASLAPSSPAAAAPAVGLTAGPAETSFQGPAEAAPGRPAASEASAPLPLRPRVVATAPAIPGSGRKAVADAEAGADSSLEDLPLDLPLAAEARPWPESRPAGANARSRPAEARSRPEARPLPLDARALSPETKAPSRDASQLHEAAGASTENPPALPLEPALPLSATQPGAVPDRRRDAGSARPAAGPAPRAGRAETPAVVAAPVLDTGAAEQIETLRKGIFKALQEAREILALLDRSPQ